MNSNEPPENPFAAPTADIAVQSSSELTPEEKIRNEHIGREQNIRSIGLLCYFSAFFLGCVLASVISHQINPDGTSYGSLEFATVVGITSGLLILNFTLAYGLRRLKSWARIPAALFSGAWMLFIPVGTVVGAVFMFLLLSPKGKYVFTEEYRAIISDTPHVRLKTSKTAVIVLLLLLGGLIFGMAFLLQTQ